MRGCTEGEVTLAVRVTGRVQGVWYRGWTRGEARRLGLRGWVRNAADGSVSAVLAGPEDVVAEMVALMRRGPDFARVTDVVTAPSNETVPEGFEIRR